MKKIIFMLCLAILVGCGEVPPPHPLLDKEGETNEVSGGGLIQEKIQISNTQNFPPSSGQLPHSKVEEPVSLLSPPNPLLSKEGETNEVSRGGNKISSWNLSPLPGDEVTLSLTTLSTHANHLIQVQWENLANIAYITIGWYSYQASIHEWSYYFEVQKNTFTPGEYFISIQDKSGEIIALNQKMTILGWQDHGINLNNITPNTLSNTQKSSIVLQWNGFSKVISVQLDNNIILKEASFDIINDRVMSIEVPKWIPVGSYHFNLLTVEKIVKLPSRALTIQP